MIQAVKYRCRCGQKVPSGQRCICQRKADHHKLYDRRAWRGLDRDKDDGLKGRYLAEHPLCEECSTDERPVPAVDVDHIVPHRGDPDLFWNWDNLAALCKRCHGRKSASER